MYDEAHYQYNYLLSRIHPTDEKYDEILKSHYYLFRSERSFNRRLYGFARIQIRLAQQHLRKVQSFDVKDKAAHDELLDLLKEIESYCKAQTHN